ncbi:MAG: HAMP domain-containing histidine kinase [Ignavibacteriales bacterium]|nr:HAMP domain-containing histidine kinase [Ignavibacteriales bacterium]
MSIPNPKIDSNKESPGSISHELRTPLTSIIGYAEIMLNDPRLSLKARQEYAKIIRDEGKRLSSFIDYYLGTKVQPRVKVLATVPKEDISTLVMSSIALVRSKAEAKSINIISHLEPITLPSKLNAMKIIQIIENLLNNAISFSPTDSQIHADVSRYVSSIQIQIRSELTQSPDAHGETLVNNFTWVHAPHVEIREQGLGLAFAKQLVELQGGRLTVTTGEEHILTMKLEFPNW